MSTVYRFPIFMLVSLLVVAGILAFVLRARRPAQRRIWLVALVVAPGGMLVAKYGAAAGMPWWLYYSIPVFITVVLPLRVFRMNRQETWVYVVLACLSAPAIHVAFSLLLGWHEYMPFLRIP